ncbi:MAG: hypothetical protein RPR97_02540 [Colwellia sp.]
MRDLGVMGESVFSLWCADAGLVANDSGIDKTGWDFFVEFPIEGSCEPDEIHNSALECKVQVKATDKKDRKLQITLSNLRRLITVQMPAFLIFIEFDGMSNAQRAFVVHIDNNIISKVLKKIHKIEQSNKPNNFNKRSMVVHYNDSHELKFLNGEFLKRKLLYHCGENMAAYAVRKNNHLETTGYEDGFADLSFTTDSKEGIRKLIDISIGSDESLNVISFSSTKKRFGIPCSQPYIESKECIISMPGIKPSRVGFAEIKESKFSSPLIFRIELYASNLNSMVPEELRKFKIDGDLFSIVFNPYTGEANYLFRYGDEKRIEILEYRNILKLACILISSGKNIILELKFGNDDNVKSKLDCGKEEFEFTKELGALNAAVNLISKFELTGNVDATFHEISYHAVGICQLEKIFNASPNEFTVEFDVDGDGFDSKKKCACLFFSKATIGNYTLGLIFSAMGNITTIKNGQFQLDTESINIEEKIVCENNEIISSDEINEILYACEDKYKDNYSVVNFFAIRNRRK